VQAPRRGFGESEVRGAARAETRFHFRTGITSVVPWLVVSGSSRRPAYVTADLVAASRSEREGNQRPIPRLVRGDPGSPLRDVVVAERADRAARAYAQLGIGEASGASGARPKLPRDQRLRRLSLVVPKQVYLRAPSRAEKNTASAAYVLVVVGNACRRLGEHDDRYQPVAEVKQRTSLMPNARFALVPGGHEPWLDDIEACSQSISGFLAGKATPRPATGSPVSHSEATASRRDA
jgi:hypothetical protein